MVVEQNLTIEKNNSAQTTDSRISSILCTLCGLINVLCGQNQFR